MIMHQGLGFGSVHHQCDIEVESAPRDKPEGYGLSPRSPLERETGVFHLKEPRYLIPSALLHMLILLCKDPRTRTTKRSLPHDKAKLSAINPRETVSRTP